MLLGIAGLATVGCRGHAGNYPGAHGCDPCESPRPPSVEQRAAELETLRGRYAEAARKGLRLSECREFVQKFEAIELVEALLVAAMASHECGDEPRAKALYERVIARAPTLSVTPYLNLGAFAWRDGKRDIASRYFERAVRIDPRSIPAHYGHAAALRRIYLDDPTDEAFEAARLPLLAVLAMDVRSARGYEELARLYFDRGRLRDPRALLLAELVATRGLHVLDARGETSPDLANTLGAVQLQRGDQLAALRWFETALRIDPDHPAANMNVGLMSLRTRDFARARRHLARAAKHERFARDPQTYLALGVAHRGLGEYERASAAYRRAGELGDGGIGRYNLAILAQQYLGSEPDALQAALDGFRAYVEVGDDPRALAEARRRIAEIEDALTRCALPDIAALEREARRGEAQHQTARDRERQRLLELERRALEAELHR